jgi:membrane fusion protein (multidrug efflux system)
MTPTRKKLTLALIFLIGLIFMLLWIQGFFSSRVGPGVAQLKGTPAQGQTYEVSWQKVLDWHEAPGLVASREQPKVAAQMMGRILEVRAVPGDPVRSGQVLAVIDDAEVRSRLGQAQDNLAALQAQYHQAETDFHRFQNLVERQVVPVREFDQIKARYHTLQAQVQQARQAIQESQAYVRYGKVVAPAPGIIAEKMIDVGDLATPGKPLFTIFDPQQMRLEAQVGEQYGPALHPGGPVKIVIPSLNLEMDATIAEVVAQAASASRTFLVKAPLPYRPDLRPGMFGRLFFDGQERRVLLIPASAVKNIGQLETVQVVGPEGVKLRQIRTGKTYGANVEVLAGLQAGERVAVSFKE